MRWQTYPQRTRWAACISAAAAVAATAAVVGATVAVGDPNVGSSPELPTTDQGTTQNTGLQQTDTFGYIPERETTTFQPGPVLNRGDPSTIGPFGGPGAPLSGAGPPSSVTAPVNPTLTTPAG